MSNLSLFSAFACRLIGIQIDLASNADVPVLLQIVFEIKCLDAMPVMLEHSLIMVAFLSLEQDLVLMHGDLCLSRIDLSSFMLYPANTLGLLCW